MSEDVKTKIRGILRDAGCPGYVDGLCKSVDDALSEAARWKEMSPADQAAARGVNPGAARRNKKRTAAKVSTADVEAADEGGGDAAEEGGPDKGKKSMVTLAVDLARQNCEFWRSGDDAYVTIGCKTHREHHRVTGRAFRQWLARAVYAATQRGISDTTIRDACGTLTGIAIFDGAEHSAHVRVGGVDDRLYLDLADSRWRAVQITTTGWTVTDKPDVRFVRRGAMRPLPVPVRGGKLDELRQHIRVTDGSWPLVVGWLVGALMARGPYPLLVLRGMHGTGKSHTARVLRDVIDPSTAPIRSEPREPRDLIVAAQAAWVVGLDNISNLAPWLSDGLCRLSTGGGYAARQLFSDGEEYVVDVQRPAVITGITDVVTAPDLLDRALLVELEPMPDGDRRTERNLLARWELARPRVLGALLDAVSCSLRRRDTVKLTTMPRLADWAVAATAAEPAIGLDDGAVMDALNATRAETVEVALDASPIAGPLRALAGGRGFEGSASTLLALLGTKVEPATTRSKQWPSTARALAGLLARLAPVFVDVGVRVERLPRAAGTRAWRVCEVAIPSSRPSPPSGVAKPQPNRNDGTGDGSGPPGREPSPGNPSDLHGRDGRDGRDGQIHSVSAHQDGDL